MEDGGRGVGWGWGWGVGEVGKFLGNFREISENSQNFPGNFRDGSDNII